ncbi:cytochrome P450 [Roridomyces roridus]|uniref:Cytochrome P450 n=1 Tax=Roridomyces roridus TaxID=1738132 RepID=A0AAD7BN33_9AGAR|nr:cytochrome P450 [Roridomyces roridus]
MESRIAPLSFVADRLIALDQANQFYREHHVQGIGEIAGTMYIASSDTTVSVLGTFVLGMLANPEAQRRAQADIDSVVGSEGLPRFEERDKLPYVSAIVKEILRWQNVTPVAIPRLLKIKDEFRGYRLPAGSLVIWNAWALLHAARRVSTQTVYPDPHTFNPERLLLNGRLNPAVPDPESAFGFGRRYGISF